MNYVQNVLTWMASAYLLGEVAGFLVAHVAHAKVRRDDRP